MPKSKFKLTFKDEALDQLMAQADHRTLGMWARDCAERVMPYFEQAHPNDPRPRQALITLQSWINTGEFSMKVIRKASLDSHAAARDVGADNPARSAARAAGQAVATAHVVRQHCWVATLTAVHGLDGLEHVGLDSFLLPAGRWQRWFGHQSIDQARAIEECVAGNQGADALGESQGRGHSTRGNQWRRQKRERRGREEPRDTGTFLFAEEAHP